MKHFAAIALLTAIPLLQGCSDAQKTSLINAAMTFDRYVDNFNAVADKYDNSVATRVSPTLARYCVSAISTGRSLLSLAPNSGTAHNALITVTTGVGSWCNNPQPQTIGDAIAAMAQVAADAAAALKKARTGG